MAPKIGKIIIIVSFIFALNPFVISFMIPMFLVGVILVWFSRKNVISNMLWCTLPVLLWYPVLTILSFSQFLTNQKFDIYFQDNYIGPVIIISNIECGQPEMKVRGREQLYIPSNGVLLYKGAIKAGIVDHKYYAIMQDGRINLIPQRSMNNKLNNSVPKVPQTDLRIAWGGGIGTRGSSYPLPEIEYTFMTLGVGPLSNPDTIYINDKLEKVESIADSLVRDCKVKCAQQ